MPIGTFQMITQGSVGMDNSLEMVLSIPVHDSWLRDPKSGALKGKIYHIPVRGTVSVPQPDIAAAIADIAKQVLGGSVKDILKGELKNGKGLLDKVDSIFNRKPKP